jgi:tripartite-type tricarboxylate transporter receptor subunit TctC
MTHTRRQTLTALAGAALCSAIGATALWAAPAAAQDAKARLAALKPKDFPTQQIEMTVVYPAGGGMDVNARILAKYFEQNTDQKVLVNNRTGGAGLIGHTYLATQAKNDGYTVGIVASLLFGDAMLRSGGRWSMDNFEPIAFLNGDSMLLVTTADGPMKGKSFKEILELAKAKPNTVRMTVVPGGIYEYMLEQLEQVSGARFLKVPFQGGAPGVTAMLGGNVDVSIAFYAEVRSQLDAKTVVPVAVTGNGRSTFVPDAPTLAEVTGDKDLAWTIARWAAVPKGTPADRKAWLAAAISAATADPALQAEFRKLGATPDPSIATAEQTTALVNRLAESERQFYLKTGRLKP